jgi:hypothetical protein
VVGANLCVCPCFRLNEMFSAIRIRAGTLVSPYDVLYNRGIKMTGNDLTSFRKWFSEYCRSFHSSDAEDQKNISLKEEHTFRVCRNASEITEALLLDDNRKMLAETVALFHDIGRFPQYAKYKTFRDSVSVNHGLLGAQTIVEKGVLQNLSGEEQDIIIQSVTFHNAFSVPKKEREEIVFFIQLIRDADKLDIWRVFLEYYEGSEESRASAVGLGLPDLPGYSEDVLSRIYHRKIIALSDIRSLNDFKLLQLSWIFDLNFQPSFAMLAQRDYIQRIAGCLPETEEMKRAVAFLKEYVRTKTSSS